MAAVDFFLKIDSIDGESLDAKHKGEIDVESWSWGASNPGAASSGGGGGTGKVSVQDFHFVARTASDSPKLMLACATGTHIKQAILTCRKSGEKQSEFLKIRLTDVLVSSYQIGATQVGGDPFPRDQFSLHFQKIEMTEISQSPTGGTGGTVFGGFDFGKNVVIPPPGPTDGGT